VLLAVSEALSIQNDAIPRIATGLCSGMGRSNGMCGALTGAVLAVSLVSGRDSPALPVEPAYAKVRELVERFREHHGSTMCSDLIGCDLSTPEGRRLSDEKERTLRCQRYVEDAARTVQGLLFAERLG
jgi:C_GCAxxG_C_C family probable redox protein